MNKTALKSLAGKRLKLRPLVVRKNPNGTLLAYKDDIWLATESSHEKITIQNLSTGHFHAIPHDGIYDFRFLPADNSNQDQAYGILKLLGFIWVSGNNAGFEPLSLPTAEALFLRQIKI